MTKARRTGDVEKSTAKLRMLEFYYDFLDRYFDRRDFELIQMDTNSNYMAISAEKSEDIVKPELQTEFEAKKQVVSLGQVEQSDPWAL